MTNQSSLSYESIIPRQRTSRSFLCLTTKPEISLSTIESLEGKQSAPGHGSATVCASTTPKATTQHSHGIVHHQVLHCHYCVFFSSDYSTVPRISIQLAGDFTNEQTDRGWPDLLPQELMASPSHTGSTCCNFWKKKHIGGFHLHQELVEHVGVCLKDLTLRRSALSSLLS